MTNKIAVISDIHANLPALEAVLSDIDEKKISQIYCLGDLVDFAPWGNEVIEVIKRAGITCLMGNHDERIAFDKPIIPLPFHTHEEKISREKAISYSKKTITFENKMWLARLPFTITLTFKTEKKIHKILLAHASPWSNDTYIYENDLEKIYGSKKMENWDLVMLGHTHIPYIKCLSDTLFVNCGSVGRSKEPDRLATYSIITIKPDKITADIHKVKYSITETAKAIYRSEIPDFYAKFLLKLHEII